MAVVAPARPAPEGLARRAEALARAALPRGRTLPDAVWRQRHRGVLVLLWVHVPVIAVFAAVRGAGPVHAAVETGAIVGFAALASVLGRVGQYRRLSTCVASLGLLTCSAVLVHLSGGVIELHFHFFVMVGVITLYQDWTPFLIAIGYVVFQHGLAGAISPDDVYNHPAAQNGPWKWAAIHGAFILALSAAGIVAWKLNESMRSEVEQVSERFRSAFDDAPIGMAMTTLDGRIVRANRALCDLLGYSDADLDGGSLTDYEVNAGDEAAVVAPRAGGVYRAEKHWRRANGAELTTLLTASEVSNSRGEPYLLCQIEDITERKAAEAALEAASARLAASNAELQRSNADLEQFAYVASHDLSEPLRAISGPIQLLARRYDDQFDDDARTAITFAVDGCQRMQTLIDDLLTYSRVGRVEADFRPVDCAALVGRTLALLGPRIEATRARVGIAGELPTVDGEEGQLGQLFLNLIGNAIKFVPAGLEPVVAVSADARDDEWVFSVTDNGIGIDESYRDRIFLMFKRLNNRDAYGGTGIGLAICKKIVERHGGRIWVEDASCGSGTRFCFTLPRREEGTQ